MQSTSGIGDFQHLLRKHYEENKRSLPWRVPEADGTFDPYKILVSEIMLQQTQVPRVTQKYRQFLAVFPDIEALAGAPLSEVLKQWQGLGYNRRAQYLHLAAKQLISKDEPWTEEDLVTCKGIGPNTTAAVLVYSYNKPEIFIETNIRSVYLYHFFNDAKNVPDKDILLLVEQTIDRQNPRNFYRALMDYGTYIKKNHGNPNRASRHYARQSRFSGSRRQIRGEVLRLLADRTKTEEELRNLIADQRLDDVLGTLSTEGLIHKTSDSYNLG